MYAIRSYYGRGQRGVAGGGAPVVGAFETVAVVGAGTDRAAWPGWGYCGGWRRNTTGWIGLV